MVFSSIPFLYYFLPAVLAVYFLVPARLKNGVLLLSSLFFYGWGEPKLLMLMVFTIALFYGCGLAIEKAGTPKGKKLWLTVSVVISIGLLGIFKYADFFIGSINAVTGLSLPLLKLALPVGISFYTFQCLSYTIDVYRGNVPAQKNPVSFGAYVALFPQLIAGPIVRYVDVARELEERKHSWEDAAYGLRRVLVGLAKKVILADNFALLIRIFRESGEQSVLFYWMYAVTFMLNIYFDFSGYSDMAIGIGKILGFEYKENFDHPYASLSVREFWRRWHISLGAFFRDYVYIPLGGNRKGLMRTVFNTLVVWSLTGFWHGAAWTFLVWGAYYGIILTIDLLGGKKITAVLPKPVNWLITMVLVIISWVIFYYPTLGQAFQHIGAMFGIGAKWIDSASLQIIKTYSFFPLIAFIGSLPVGNTIKRILGARADGKIVNTLRLAWMTGCLILSIFYLVGQSYNPFIYFQF